MSSIVALQSRPSLSSTTTNFPTSEEFRASIHPQYFSLPGPLIFYIAKNPRSMKVYKKLIRSCKYFFLKKPILFFQCLHFVQNEWSTCVDGKCYSLYKDQKCRKIGLDMKRIQSKIRVTVRLEIASNDSSVASELVPKLYRGNVITVKLHGQKISFDDLLFLSREIVQLEECLVLDHDGVEVSLEGMIANLPRLQLLSIRQTNELYDFTNTAIELINLHNFKNLKLFFFEGLNESFDIGTFFEFLKKNKITAVGLCFYGQFSEEFKEKLEEIVDEVLDTDTPKEYIPPYITFDGEDPLKREALDKLWESKK